MSHYRPKLGPVNASDEYILLQERGTASGKTRHPEIIEPKQSWRDGYHVGVLCCTTTAAVVLLINVILCAVASAKHEIAGGFGTLFEGDCDKVKRVNLWLHLLINILSTLLLGASNYTMQCVSAPTRTDIDKAHRNHSWMDIGIPSVRNLGRISWPRKILWCCLILSSVPLHLIYNSVIFSSTSIASSNAFIVTSDFLSGAPYTSPDPDHPVDADLLGRLQGFRDWAKVNNSSRVSLTSKDCINTYGKSDLVSEWGDSLAILERQSTGNSFVAVSGAPEIRGRKFARIFCGYTALICKGNNLTYYENLISQPISSCVGTKVNQHCQVRFSVGLMIGVIICNVIKLICMCLVVWKADPRLLVTLGDALVSFLENPGSVVLLAGILNGFRPYRKTGMPLASSCSAAISAACHPPPGDDGASKKAVNWGAIADETGDAENDALINELRFTQNGGMVDRADRKRPKVGHCSFTSFTVSEPVEHEPYAGMSESE
ncbi:MAG: hypothetical protein OHK93_004472 [Ramalina farinacea]|uniref:DUF6536 domain-containing protein n=1 Tax=Ramalina farinacea TaxID=258253 RepID=A0AA43U0C0_9LECA|nr:hypothetical protein [Ramalina farinacea]